MSPRQSFEHALLLIARQHGGSPAAALAADQELARWREQGADHDTIYRLALDAWQASNPGGLQDRLARPPPSIRRRKIVAALAVLGVSGLTGAMARWWWLQPLEIATLETGRAQSQTLRMGDGSELHLAARSSAGVAYFRNRREVTLAAGEILLQVASDRSRPFTVRTRWGKVEVLGTTFTVAVRDDAMAVEVAQGRVAVWRAGDQARPASAAPDFDLHPGDAVRIDRDGKAEQSRLAVTNVGAWKDGWMVFDRTPLADAVLRWNDYLARPLVLGADKSLDGLRLTGSFRLAEPELFLQALPKVLPVKLVQRQEGPMMILAR
ncbi:FecR family protein [Herbaspirillum sp. alder98]|uniref:FecR family protein n=1 Tax=Herbaspirillum sp. alder98 TaxID=2913096 RepID=UPI001CD87119|nr:FecR domain-containing protein [Herbaspirillum sp. alder98]MCA1326108.1 FecR domain-containing protein [Herbaspirillum sp. alder98]